MLNSSLPHLCCVQVIVAESFGGNDEPVDTLMANLVGVGAEVCVFLFICGMCCPAAAAAALRQPTPLAAALCRAKPTVRQLMVTVALIGFQTLCKPL